ncbi:MAG: hypothetical protein Q9221_006465 [Calogaya cf. arnoldii]
MLRLETVLGSTGLSINALSAAVDSRCFAFCAGSIVVLADVNSLETRNFSVKFDKLPAQVTPSFYNPATPTKATSNRAFANTPSKDDSLQSIASIDSNDYPGKGKLSHRSRTQCVALSPAGKYLAIGEVGYHPRILVFSTAPGASPDIPVACLTEHTFGVQAIAFSSDSKWLCSLGDLHDGGLFLWSINPKTGALKLDSSNRCTTADTITWMGTSVITVGTRHVKVWRFEQPSSPAKCRRGLDTISDISTASPVPKTFAGRNVLLGALKDAVFTCAVAIAEDAAVLCTQGGSVCLLDDAHRSQRLCQVAKRDYSITCVTLDPSSRVIWLGGKGVEPEALPLSTFFAAREPSAALEEHENVCIPSQWGSNKDLSTSAICYADNRLVCADASLVPLDSPLAPDGRDRTIQIFRVSKNECSLEQSLINEHAGPIRQIDFTQDGSILVSMSSDRTLVIHQRVTRTDDSVAFVSTRTIHLKASPTSMTLVPDALLISTMDRCVRKISFGEGNTTQTFKAADSSNNESVTLSRLTVGIIAQHPSRATVLAGFSSADGSIRLYNVETGALLACVQGQTAVSDLALVQISEPGGTMKTRLVSTGGSNGTIMLWNLTMPSQDGTKQLGGNGFSSPDPSKPKPGSSMRLVRRVLSKAEIASFQRSLKEKGDNKSSLPRNMSPSRLRRKPSRYAISDPSDVSEPQVASRTHSSELTGRGTVRGNRLKHASPPLSPKVKLQSRLRRSSLDERHRHTVTKSADNIDATAKQISNTLEDFRKVLGSSRESLSINSAQALKRQLQATMDAIAPIDQRSDRIRDEVGSESFDEYLASMIDQRLALQARKEDQTNATSGGQTPDASTV